VKGLVGENTSVCIRVTFIEIVRTFNSRSNLNRFQIELETVSNYTTISTESCVSVTADIVYYPLLHILALDPVHFLRKFTGMTSGRPTRAHTHTPPQRQPNAAISRPHAQAQAPPQMDLVRVRLVVRRKVPCAPRRLDVVRCERAILHGLPAAERIGQDGRPVIHEMHAERDDERAADKVAEERSGLVKP